MLLLKIIRWELRSPRKEHLEELQGEADWLIPFLASWFLSRRVLWRILEWQTHISLLHQFTQLGHMLRLFQLNLRQLSHLQDMQHLRSWAWVQLTQAPLSNISSSSQSPHHTSTFQAHRQWASSPHLIRLLAHQALPALNTYKLHRFRRHLKWKPQRKKILKIKHPLSRLITLWINSISNRELLYKEWNNIMMKNRDNLTIKIKWEETIKTMAPPTVIW